MSTKTLTHSSAALEEAMNSVSYIRVGNKIRYFGVNGDAFLLSDEPPISGAQSMPDLSRLPTNSSQHRVSEEGESETDETGSLVSSTSSLVGATAADSSSSASTPTGSSSQISCSPTTQPTPMAVGLPLKLPRPPAAHLPPPLPSRPPSGSPSVSATTTPTLSHSSSQSCLTQASTNASSFPPDPTTDNARNAKYSRSSSLSHSDPVTSYPIVTSPTFYRSSGTLTVSVSRDNSPRSHSMSSPSSPQTPTTPTPTTPTPTSSFSALVQLRKPSTNLLLAAAGIASVASGSLSAARLRANQRQEEHSGTVPSGARGSEREGQRPATPDSGIDCQLDHKGHEVGSPKSGSTAPKKDPSLEVSDKKRSIIPPELGTLYQGSMAMADLVTGALASYRNKPKQTRDRTKTPADTSKSKRKDDSVPPSPSASAATSDKGTDKDRTHSRAAPEKTQAEHKKQAGTEKSKTEKLGADKLRTDKLETEKPSKVTPAPDNAPSKSSRESRSVLKRRPVKPRFEKGPNCRQCARAFGFRCKRHHCRRCWKSFCEKCLPVQRYNPFDQEGESSILSRICRACDMENAYENCRGQTRGLWSQFEALRKEARDGKGLDVTSKVDKSDQQQTIHDLTLLLRKVCVTFLVELQHQLERSRAKVSTTTRLWETTTGKNPKSQKVKVKESNKECTACKRHLRYLTESRDCAVCGLHFCTFCTARTLQLYLPKGTPLTKDIGVDMIRFYIRTEEHDEVHEIEASELYFTCLQCEDTADRFLKILEFNQKIPALEATLFDLQRQIDHALSYSPYPMMGMQRSVSTTNLSSNGNNCHTRIQDANIKLAHRLYERYLRAYGMLEQMQPQTGIQKTLHKHIKQAMYNFYLARREQLQTTFRRRGSLIQIAEFPG